MSTHYKNICPKCDGVSQCKCMGERTVTHNLCNDCKQLREDAVAGSTGAGAIAGNRGLLFTGVKELIKRDIVAKVPVIKFKNPEVNHNRRMKSIAEGRRSFNAYLLAEEVAGQEDFDSTEIFSKLSQNAKIAADLEGDNLAVFGMESDDGSITKVYVQKQQAKEFENALADALKDCTESNQREIADVLFDLKDKFKIVDVKWPSIEEDEEQAVTPATDGADTGLGDNPAGAPGADGAPGGGPFADASSPDGAAPDGTEPDGSEADAGAGSSQSDTLKQILDMLRADSDARKADAEARAAEAHAKEAESTAKIASIKMQGEEEVLDAEAYFKDRKEEKKESDRLRMLAKFRQETKPEEAAPTQPTPGTEEEEHVSRVRKTLLDLLNNRG